MSRDYYLSDDDTKALTGGKVKWSAQRRALVQLGKAFDVTPEGKPLVLKDQPAGRKKGQPKWDAA